MLLTHNKFMFLSLSILRLYRARHHGWSVPRVETLIIIHNFSAGSGQKPSATIDCLESIARWCQQIQAGSICLQPVSSVDYGWFGFLSGGNDFGLSRMYCSKRSS